MNPIPSPDQLAAAAANVWDKAVGGGLADLRSWPASIIDEGPQRTVYRYHPAAGRAPAGPPVRSCRLGGRRIELDRARVPVLAVGGTGDGIAPLPAVHHVGHLLRGAPSVRLESAPGGHLGVLTGRAARRTTWRHLDRFLAGPEAGRGERRLRAVA